MPRWAHKQPCKGQGSLWTSGVSAPCTTERQQPSAICTTGAPPFSCRSDTTGSAAVWAGQHAFALCEPTSRVTASASLGEAGRLHHTAICVRSQPSFAGLFNDLATLFLSNPDDTIKHIFSLGNLTPHAEVCQGENCYFTLRSLAILSPAYLLLMAAGASLTIPGGLFMPSIMVWFLSVLICTPCTACSTLSWRPGLRLTSSFPGTHLQASY